jgi:hypothetical protein
LPSTRSVIFSPDIIFAYTQVMWRCMTYE